MKKMIIISFFASPQDEAQRVGIAMWRRVLKDQ
jgi:hypothetical protein